MPDPLVVQLANEFRRQLQARDAVQMAEMARRWLRVERRLRAVSYTHLRRRRC